MLAGVWLAAFVAGFFAVSDPILLGKYFEQRYSVFNRSAVFGQVEPEEPQPLLRVRDTPETCKPGELIVFDASDSTVENLYWKIVPATPNFVVADDGRKAYFTQPRGGEFLVIVVGADGDVPHILIREIKVAGGPRPASTLADHVYNWYQAVEPYESKRVDAARLAQSFRALAGAGIDPNAMLEATATANRAALGTNLDYWKPFLDGLGEYLDTNRPADYPATWRQIANAIDEST